MKSFKIGKVINNSLKIILEHDGSIKERNGGDGKIIQLTQLFLLNSASSKMFTGRKMLKF